MFLIIPTFFFGCVNMVKGRPWNSERKCWDQLQDAGISSDKTFDDALVIAKSPEGVYWRFPSPTIPDDFIEGDFSLEPDYPNRNDYCD